MTLSLVIEIVHLLGHNVRRIANRTADHLVMLENRCANLSVIVLFENPRVKFSTYCHLAESCGSKSCVPLGFVVS